MKRALLVIDVQNEYFTGKLKVTHPPGSFENILKAMDAANRNRLPIILIQHTANSADSPVFRKGSPEWEIRPEVLKRPHDAMIEKHMPGSFTDTPLERLLRELGADTVVVCGYMTHMCCDTTARQAFHMGFSVEFLSDATGTFGFTTDAGSVTAEELQRAVLVTQGMRFSRVMKTEAWIEALQHPDRPPGPSASAPSCGG